MTSHSHSKVGAVVLAAGKASRMGEPKQLTVLDGRPLLQHTLDHLRASQASDIVVVLGFAADAIRQRIQAEGITIVENKDYGQGMGSSLRSGLSALDVGTEAALIVLADQPFVRSKTYNTIIEQYRQSEAQIVIPTYRGFRGNPVLLDHSVFPEVMALTGDVGCRAIFGDHPDGIVKVAVEDIGILVDIDNPTDLARARGYGRLTHQGPALLETLDLRERTVPETREASNERGDLIIVGSEPVAIAVARLGKLLQFHVTVVDPLIEVSELPEADTVLDALDFSGLSHDATCFVVIASRGRFDEEAIEQALTANIGYVALVANRKRAEELRRRLLSLGHSAKQLEALRAPAGLDIGAESPEEIALSILAEIVSLKRKGDGSNRVAKT